MTIGVIPPSPRDTKYSGSDLDDDNSSRRSRKESVQERRSVDKPNPALSFSTSPEAGAPEFREDQLPTPQPGRPGTASRPSPLDRNDTIVPARKLTPASSTGNLRQFVEQASHSDLGNMLLGGSLNGKGVERSGSVKSNRSQTIPVPPNPYHGRAATSPNFDGTEEAPPPMPISESPTAMRLTASPPSSPTPDSSMHINRTQTLNPTLLVPGGGKDSDSASIISKKKGWRKPSLNSQSKKPTGLAAAIAASGMAMANPVVSQQMSTQMQQQQQQMSPTSTSPPKLPSKDVNGSPTRHKKHNGRHVASASVASVVSGTSNTHPHRSRQASVSHSNGGENSDGMYDSGLEGYGDSDEEEDSEDDDLLNDLREDIPVTGFAVASNKRNADFHELFPSIPEGDYLIEGEWFILFYCVSG